MENLISMTDFVLEQEDFFDMFNPKGMENELQKTYNYIFKYANFLKQPLELGMFVPCDEDSNVVEYIKNPYEIFCDKENICRVISKEEIKYQKAKERVLFEYKIDLSTAKFHILKNRIVEDLLTDDDKYALTPTALKQLGL